MRFAAIAVFAASASIAIVGLVSGSEQKINIVARGKSYAIHQYRGCVLLDDRFVTRHPGIVISHTNLDSGEMKCLLSTGQYGPSDTYGSSRSGTEGMPLVRLVGLLQDDFRIILLVFRGTAEFSPFGQTYSIPPDGGTYHLEVYSKATGDAVFTTNFSRDQGPKGELPTETTKSGLIQEAKNGFVVFANTFEFGEDGKVYLKK
jgi:hypothetical protein